MISEMPVGVKKNLLEPRDYFFPNPFLAFLYFTRQRCGSAGELILWLFFETSLVCTPPCVIHVCLLACDCLQSPLLAVGRVAPDGQSVLIHQRIRR